jgi:hypothetical protein
MEVNANREAENPSFMYNLAKRHLYIELDVIC